MDRQLVSEELKLIAWGGIKAVQEKASLHTFVTGLKLEYIKEKILCQEFDIHDRIESILWLTGAAMRIEDILCRKRALQIFIQVYSKETESPLIKEKKELKKDTDIGWEIGNIAFLTRAMAEAGYLSQNEAWAFIRKAHRYGIEYGFNSWTEFAKSYALGAAKRSQDKKATMQSILFAQNHLLQKGNIWAKNNPWKKPNIELLGSFRNR